MAEFTLLEIHLEDATITANAPFSDAGTGTESGAASDRDAGGTTGEDESGPALLRVLGVVAALVVVAVLLRRLIGGADEEITAADHPADDD